MKASAFLVLSLTTAHLLGAQEECSPDHPAQCYNELCNCVYCLGPSNDGVNAPVHPFTCDGDLEITVSGFYWKSYQDGMEYAIQTETSTAVADRFRLVDADFKNPDFRSNFGFKAGLGYNTTCDGWDVGLLWTWYQGRASSKNQAEADDNVTLLALWSDQKTGASTGNPLFATEIQTGWKLKLNLVDFELGRRYWNSPRVDLRPFVGLRIAYLDQDYEIEHSGGSWSSLQANNSVDLRNNFHGVGIRAGMNSNWNFGCGWAFYGDFGLSQIFGKFAVGHDETDRGIDAPFSKTKVLEAKDAFRTTSLFVDLGLGLRYTALLCECDYALSVALGYEQHLFLHQNQFWRVIPQEGILPTTINNIYHQRRGDLSTQGWTLQFVFDF